MKLLTKAIIVHGERFGVKSCGKLILRFNGPAGGRFAAVESDIFWINIKAVDRG